MCGTFQIEDGLLGHYSNGSNVMWKYIVMCWCAVALSVPALAHVNHVQEFSTKQSTSLMTLEEQGQRMLALRRVSRQAAAAGDMCAAATYAQEALAIEQTTADAIRLQLTLTGSTASFEATQFLALAVGNLQDGSPSLEMMRLAAPPEGCEKEYEEISSPAS